MEREGETWREKKRKWEKERENKRKGEKGRERKIRDRYRNTKTCRKI